MTWKKTVLASSTALFFATISFAGGPDHRVCDTCKLHYGGFTVGLNWSTYGGTDTALMLGYYGENFLVDLSWNFENIKVDATNTRFHINELRAHLGMRRRIYNNLFFSFGAGGSYGIRSVTTQFRIDPYAIGAFIGLEYQPLQHFLFSAKIFPYMYLRDFNRNTINRVFAEGSLSVSYVFN